MVMLDKACSEQLAACNIFLLRIKPDEAVKNLEKSISDAEQLLLKYQSYDKSILSTIHFLPVDSSNFPRDRTHSSHIGIDPVIYIFINKENKVIEARVFEKVNMTSPLPQHFYREDISVNEIPENEIDLQTRTEIIKKLSLHNAISFSAFNFEAYKAWKDDCMQMLDDIDCNSNKNWFPDDRYDLGQNKDKAFLELFSRQISSLKTRLKRYTSSRKISLKWLILKNKFIDTLKWPIKMGKKLAENWIITSIVGLTSGGIIYSLWEKIKQALGGLA